MSDNKKEKAEKTAVPASPVQTIVMQDLPFGMTHVPLGWGLMTGAFMSFASFALDSKNIKEQYLEQTNVNLMEFENQSLLEQMIDNSTGYAESVLGKFLDWLAVNHWGLEEEFDIGIEDIEAEGLRTVDDVVKFVNAGIKA